VVQRLRLPASTVEGEGSEYSIPDQGSSSCHMLRQKKKKKSGYRGGISRMTENL